MACDAADASHHLATLGRYAQVRARVEYQDRGPRLVDDDEIHAAVVTGTVTSEMRHGRRRLPKTVGA